MTGSGKTGLVTVLVEEALRTKCRCSSSTSRATCRTCCSRFRPSLRRRSLPWVDASASATDARSPDAIADRARRRATQRADALGASASPSSRRFARSRRRPRDHAGRVRGRAAARALVARAALGALGRRSRVGARGARARRCRCSCGCSGAIPIRPRAASTCCSRCSPSGACAAGQSADLGALLEDLAKPPIERIGALDIDAFLPKRERRALAAALNTLLASPTFASWRQGTTLDVGGVADARRRDARRR